MSKEDTAQATQFAEAFNKLSYGDQRYMEGLLDGMSKSEKNTTADPNPAATADPNPAATAKDGN